jgi:2-polyprenyl-3-methyl-5-hydroxy-6-metoxy-1,4-benzoquinol methylase
MTLKKAISWCVNKLGYNVLIINKKKHGFSAIDVNAKQAIDVSMKRKSEFVEFEDRRDFYEATANLVALENLEGKAVLDVSCGVGVLCDVLSKKCNPSIFNAYDFSDSCVEVTQKRNIPKLVCKVHDLYNPIETKFDTIFCTETLEHLLYPNIALQNILSALNPKGIAIVTIPNGKLDVYEGHINFWSIDSFGIFLNEHIDTQLFDVEFGFFYQYQKHLFAKISKKQ